MDSTQQPQQTPSTPPAAPVNPAFTPPPAPAPSEPLTGSAEPRNFLVTFLLAAGYGSLLGLRHFYLGQKTLGLVRLGLFAGGYLLWIVGAVAQSGVLMLVSGLAILVAYIWAMVDFFVVYLSVKTDADNQPLTKTKRDAKWAKVIFLITVISIVLIFVAGVAFGVAGENILKKQLDSTTDTGSSLEFNEDTMFDDSYDFDYNADSSYDYQTQ